MCDAAPGTATEGEAGSDDDDDWGDDFGTFEEAAEVADEQPSARAAEHAPASPLPEAPSENVEVSEMSELFSASPDELLQAVCVPHLWLSVIANDNCAFPEDCCSTSVQGTGDGISHKTQHVKMFLTNVCGVLWISEAGL